MIFNTTLKAQFLWHVYGTKYALTSPPRFNYQTKLDTIRIQNSILQFAAKRHAKVTQHFAEQEKMQVNRVTVL